MPAYLVEIPSDKATNFGVDTQVVFAPDEAGARQIAAGRFGGDANAMWNTLATVTEITTGSNLDAAGDDWQAFCRISGGMNQTVDPIVAKVDTKNNDPATGIKRSRDSYHLSESTVLNDGGTPTYVAGELLTAVGGTFIRPATVRISDINIGVPQAIELVDPGDYSVLPSPLTAVPTTGGSSTGVLLDLTVASADSFEALLARLVTALNGAADIAGAAVDMSENGGPGGTALRALTVADGSGDALGDATVELEIRQNGTAYAAMVGTITHEGAAGAALSVAIPASPLPYPLAVSLKGAG